MNFEDYFLIIYPEIFCNKYLCVHLLFYYYSCSLFFLFDKFILIKIIYFSCLFLSSILIFLF